MARQILRVMQVLATVLFIATFNESRAGHWIGWFAPMLLVAMVAVNSLFPNRFLSWLIFSLAFFGFLVVLSAFTLRWRVEPGFRPLPFYRALAMYVAFVYVSLGQLKLLVGGGAKPSDPAEPVQEKP
jgi:hypothetical protein